MDPGVVLKCVGRRGLSEEKSVVFFASRYVELGSMVQSKVRDETSHSMRTLVQSLHDYDVPTVRDERQVVRKTGLAPLNEFLCVPQLWCLVFDSSKRYFSPLTESCLRKWRRLDHYV